MATPAASTPRSSLRSTSLSSWRVTLRNARYRKNAPSRSPIAPNATRLMTSRASEEVGLGATSVTGSHRSQISSVDLCSEIVRAGGSRGGPFCRSWFWHGPGHAEAPPDDRPDDRDDMMSHDLLAFLVASPLIAYGNFIDNLRTGDDTAQNFGVLIPSHRNQFARVQEISAIEDVAGKNVGEGRIEQNVKYRSDHAVSNFVPEELHARVASGEEPASQHDLGVEIEHRK